jgi:hypothetical protein
LLKYQHQNIIISYNPFKLQPSNHCPVELKCPKAQGWKRHRAGYACEGTAYSPLLLLIKICGSLPLINIT